MRWEVQRNTSLPEARSACNGSLNWRNAICLNAACTLGSVFVQTKRLPRVKPFLPRGLKSNDITGVHNTVLVDGRSQNPAAGRLEFFAANDEYAVAVAHCGDAYPGTTHRRLPCLLPGSLVLAGCSSGIPGRNGPEAVSVLFSIGKRPVGR